MKYIPSATGRLFHLDHTSKVKYLQGPFGSGKSVAAILEMIQIATRQEPGPDGVRRYKWAVVRNTYPQLRNTTIKTFQTWIPGDVCPIVYKSPIEGLMHRQLPDGTTLHIEFVFMAIDSEEALSNLLSLDLSSAWINEASEVSHRAFTGVLGRTGRYPPKGQGALQWSGVIMDSNPPPINSWLHKMVTTEKAATTAFFQQPPALLIQYPQGHEGDMEHAQFLPNPSAENIEHLQLGYDYYIDIAEQSRHDPEHVKRVVLGEFTLGLKGRPIYSMFRYSSHVREHMERADRSSLLVIGMDFGLHPAAVFTQYVDGQVRVLSELAPEDILFDEFLEDVFVPHLRTNYPGFQVIVVGDPSGVNRNAMSVHTPISRLASFGLTTIPAKSNTISPRLDAVNWFLRRERAFVVAEECRMLVAGFAGGYQWAKAQSSFSTQRTVPDKNEFSHPHDALQYALMYYRDGGDVFADTQFNSMGSPMAAMGGQKRGFLYV